MPIYLKITIIRTILYYDQFFISCGEASRFVKNHLGLSLSKTQISKLLNAHGITIADIKTRPQREDLQSVYDDLLLAVGWCKMTSQRELARLNGIPRTTLQKRLKSGWDKMDALIIPPYKLKITDNQIIDCERLGLTINRSAIILNISHRALQLRIKKLGITWRGKGRQIGAKQ